MGSRAEHLAIAWQAVDAALDAERRGDAQTYQRERRVVIAHSIAAREAADDEED